MSQAIESSTIGQPTIEIVSLFPKQGHWTESDYFRLPETNRIIELSEGMLIMTPSPTEKHQRISAKMFSLIWNHVLLNNIGDVRYSPLDVWLYDGVVREPDIVFMSNEHRDRITEKFWGVPDLVVEILSEGTAKVDKEDKYLEYQRAGVLEYWIVDPDKQTVEVFELKDRRYAMIGSFHGSDIVTSNVLKDFSFKAESIFV